MGMAMIHATFILLFGLVRVMGRRKTKNSKVILILISFLFLNIQVQCNQRNVLSSPHETLLLLRNDRSNQLPELPVNLNVNLRFNEANIIRHYTSISSPSPEHSKGLNSEGHEEDIVTSHFSGSDQYKTGTGTKTAKICELEALVANANAKNDTLRRDKRGNLTPQEFGVWGIHLHQDSRFVLSTNTAEKYKYEIISASIITFQGVVLYAFGQPPVARSGNIKLWDGNIMGEGNSQHLIDWYTFTHVLHGFIFYGILTLATPTWPIALRFVLALGAEAGWEILENSPIIIQRYRKSEMYSGYSGDSIINSVSDTLAMAFGFFLASKLPVLVIVILGIAEELFLGSMIYDNLTINVIQLIHPVEVLSKWQTESWIGLDRGTED